MIRREKMYQDGRILPGSNVERELKRTSLVVVERERTLIKFLTNKFREAKKVKPEKEIIGFSF